MLLIIPVCRSFDRFKAFQQFRNQGQIYKLMFKLHGLELLSGKEIQ